MRLYTTAVSFHEQVTGWSAYLSRADEPERVVLAYAKLEQVLETYAQTQVLPMDLPAALRFEELRRERVRIGTLDLRIASIAMTRDMTVLTRNLVDFAKVPGLRVEDWTA